MNNIKAHLGLRGIYAAGVILDLSWRVVAVRTHTLPSLMLAKINWPTHEYVASVTEPLDSGGNHCHQ